jgi:hypothetical protein
MQAATGTGSRPHANDSNEGIRQRWNKPWRVAVALQIVVDLTAAQLARNGARISQT